MKLTGLECWVERRKREDRGALHNPFPRVHGVGLKDFHKDQISFSPGSVNPSSDLAELGQFYADFMGERMRTTGGEGRGGEEKSKTKKNNKKKLN